MSPRVLVLGVGPQGPASLTPAWQARIAQADELWGGRRLLALWPDHPGSRLAIGDNVAELAARLRQRGRARIVVLASGDPGFYGIAGTLLHELSADELEIVPHVSSLQLAFARAGLAWSDAILTSAHARPLAEVVGWARRAHKLGILTDPEHTPGAIARALLAAGAPDCRAIVAENLALPEERLVDTRLSSLPTLEFSPLNVLLLLQDAGWRPRPLLALRPDECYEHRRGLITKSDARALSLARLALSDSDTVWDIGAGSGAMSIEMAELAWRGQVWAIEQDAENMGYLHRNVARHGALNVHPVAGRAPAALAGLPAPHAVFVGGSGGELAGILQHVAEAAQTGCRVVINLATLENLQLAREVLCDLGAEPSLAQVNIAHGQPLGGLTRLAPLNPVFILAAVLRTGPGEGAGRTGGTICG